LSARARGDDDEVDEDAVGDEQPVRALDQGRVEESERADGALDRAGEGAADGEDLDAANG